MEEMVGFQTTLPPGSENDVVKPGVQNMTAAPHAILVDQSAVRYMNEGGSYMAYWQGHVGAPQGSTRCTQLGGV